MKKLFIIPTIIFLFSNCQKRRIGYIEVHGWLTNYITNLPLEADVSLIADDVHSGKSSGDHSITLTTSRSTKNGSFSLKTRPSKGERYYLYINGKPCNISAYGQINVKENTYNDIGQIIVH